jgi:hypothetical protein
MDEREADIARWIVGMAPSGDGLDGLSIRGRWDAKYPRGFTLKEIWINALKMRDDIPFGTVLQRQVAKCLKRLGCSQPSGSGRKKTIMERGRPYWLPPEEADWIFKMEPTPEPTTTNAPDDDIQNSPDDDIPF